MTLRVSSPTDAVEDGHDSRGARFKVLETSEGAAVEDEGEMFDAEYVRNGADDA